MYYVWKREDGYIGATNRTKALFNIASYLGKCFTILFETENWEEARDRVAAERSKPDYFYDKPCVVTSGPPEGHWHVSCNKPSVGMRGDFPMCTEHMQMFDPNNQA